MGITPTSTASIMNYLQQQTNVQRQHNDLDAQVSESVTRARQDAVDQVLEENTKLAEQVTAVKKAAVQMRSGSGSIDVWA